MNATLTDRYVDAAMRSVPDAQRDDLAAELRGSIDDQIDARVEEGEPRPDAERAVLTDRPLHLIGPKYYLEWWRLLKLLLWIVLPCAAFGISLGQVLAGSSFGEVIGTVIPALLGVGVNLCFWVTLVFFIVERTGTPVGSRWTVDSLPEPRDRRAGVGFGEMVASLVFLALAAGAVLWDQFIGFAPAYPGVPFLSEGLWPGWIAFLFVVMAIEAALAVTVYLVRRWTPALAIVNTVLALAVAVPALVLLSRGELLNPDFWSTVIPDDSASRVASVVSVITGFGIAALAVWDIVDVWLKTARGRR